MSPRILVFVLFSAVVLEKGSTFPQINRAITEADGFIFDGPADRSPGRNVDGSTRRQIPISTTSAPQSSTQVSQDLNNCIDNCPVTSEYNPVCGNDNVQYRNPGRLNCAVQCGINVALHHYGPCSSLMGRG